jgi:hypothetical protein
MTEATIPSPPLPKVRLGPPAFDSGPGSCVRLAYVPAHTRLTWSCVTWLANGPIQPHMRGKLMTHIGGRRVLSPTAHM